MHDYYKNSIPKLKKSMHGLLKYIRTELEEDTGKSYSLVFDEIWQIYEIRMLEHFPYIGGDKVSGTKNLTGSYCFVAMGEVLKQYGKDMEHIGYLMVLAYTRQTEAMSGIAKMIARKVFTNPKLLKKMFTKKDASNAENAAKYPGSFETKVQEPTSEYPFIYHNLVCPLSDFAKKYGFEEYMPYLAIWIMPCSEHWEHRCIEPIHASLTVITATFASNRERRFLRHGLRSLRRRKDSNKLPKLAKETGENGMFMSCKVAVLVGLSGSAMQT